VPGRAAALCQPESGALQPDVGSACADIIIEKASSEDRRGHSPQTPRGGTPQGGKQHTGKPTRQQLRLPLRPPQLGQDGATLHLDTSLLHSATATFDLYLYLYLYLPYPTYAYTHTVIITPPPPPPPFTLTTPTNFPSPPPPV